MKSMKDMKEEISEKMIHRTDRQSWEHSPGQEECDLLNSSSSCSSCPSWFNFRSYAPDFFNASRISTSSSSVRVGVGGGGGAGFSSSAVRRS